MKRLALILSIHTPPGELGGGSMEEKRKRGERNWEQFEEAYSLLLPTPDHALEQNPYPAIETTVFVHGYEFIIALDGKLEYIG